MKALYTAHAISTAGRDGHVETDDKKISLNLGRPGSNDAGTNPEQLFACGYSACFGGAVLAVGRKKGLTLDGKDVRVEADVTLNQDDANGFFISVGLNVTINGVDNAAAAEIVTDAHQLCPYSKATRGNVEVTLTANGHKAAA